ncbi:hypothetical protein [Diaphorobacter ruginosibacter]|uniref:hypothetical protein n=1 Tax=Diaphorobacter ruginosibacter TaxID=1715720 RepID=UPI00333EEF7E
MMTPDNSAMEFSTRIALHEAVLAQLVALVMRAQSNPQGQLAAFEQSLVESMGTIGRSDRQDFSVDQAVWMREQHAYGRQLASEFASMVAAYMPRN